MEISLTVLTEGLNELSDKQTFLCFSGAPKLSVMNKHYFISKKKAIENVKTCICPTEVHGKSGEKDGLTIQ